MHRALSVAVAGLALSATVAVPALAATDFSFLDDMTTEELTELQAEVNDRLDAAEQAEVQANPADLGAWEILYFVDEFNDPTDIPYASMWVSDGDFSNSVVDNRELSSELNIQTYDDGYSIFINLYEYGNHRLKGDICTRTYDISVKGSNGDIVYTSGILYEGGDRIKVDPNGTGSEELITLMSSCDSVKIKIESNDGIGLDVYFFTIDDTTGLANALAQINPEAAEASSDSSSESSDGSTAADEPAAGTYTDGEYTATGTGIGGKFDVTVTIEGGVIASVEVGDNSETQGIGSKAIEQLPALIVEANGTDDVDGVSGASVTSKAIFTAVNDCLEQASA